MDKLQKEFEAWVESEFRTWAIQSRPGVYGSEQIQDMWKAWQAALSANGGEATPYGYLREVDGRVQLSVGPECPPNRSGGIATPWQAIFEHPAPPSVAVPEGLKSKVMELCSAVENDEDLPPVKYALKCGRLINEVKDMLAAAPSPNHIPDAGKVAVQRGVIERLRGISVMVANGKCGPDIDRHIHDVIAMLTSATPSVPENEIKARVVSGARDMLRESGKQFRAIGDIGHAAMCENHADELDRLRTAGDEGEGA